LHHRVRTIEKQTTVCFIADFAALVNFSGAKG